MISMNWRGTSISARYLPISERSWRIRRRRDLVASWRRQSPRSLDDEVRARCRCAQHLLPRLESRRLRNDICGPYKQGSSQGSRSSPPNLVGGPLIRWRDLYTEERCVSTVLRFRSIPCGSADLFLLRLQLTHRVTTVRRCIRRDDSGEEFWRTRRRPPAGLFLSIECYGTSLGWAGVLTDTVWQPEPDQRV